jgi:hypothetical protein
MTEEVKAAVTFARNWPQNVTIEMERALLPLKTEKDGYVTMTALRILCDEVERLHSEEDRQCIEATSS